MARKIKNDILSSKQKNELTQVIDSLVEERVKERQSKFIEKYTSFIVESTTKKLTEAVKGQLSEDMQNEIDKVNDKAQRLCRSVILESSNKISTYKKNQEKLIEEFKTKAPEMIENLAEEKAQKIQEEAIQTIDKYKNNVKIVESMKQTLEQSGFVINEDVNSVIKTKTNEVMGLKTQLNKAQRDLKIAELTEGMLPNQKKNMVNLLEDYSTDTEVEKHFKESKDKILSENRMIVEEEVVAIPDNKVTKKLEEDRVFSDFLSLSKEFNDKK